MNKKEGEILGNWKMWEYDVFKVTHILSASTGGKQSWARQYLYLKSIQIFFLILLYPNLYPDTLFEFKNTCIQFRIILESICIWIE